MIGIDTNVLVRYVVEDDGEQTARAAALLEGATGGLFVPQVVFCELVWVLESVYRTPKARVVALLRDLVRTRQLVVEGPDQLHRALSAFAAGEGDFADYVIGQRCRAAGCDQVATFDKALLKEAGFVRP